MGKVGTSQLVQLARLVKARLTIPELAEVYGYEYREEFRNPCPSCESESTSKKTLGIFDDGTRFKCFHCGEWGDVVDWIALKSNLTKGQAIISLAARLGIEAGSPIQAWLARIQWARESRREKKSKVKEIPVVILAKVARDCEQTMTPRARVRIARHLGLTPESLLAFRVGWHRKKRACTFPFYDHNFGIRGVRIRKLNGEKKAVYGSADGLFLPRDFRESSGPILVTESATDSPALYGLGFRRSIGRTSADTGIRFLVPLCRGEDVVFMAQRDRAGVRSALLFADILAESSASVRIAMPPRGIKDYRESVRAGHSRADVGGWIGSARVVKSGPESPENWVKKIFEKMSKGD